MREAFYNAIHILEDNDGEREPQSSITLLNHSPNAVLGDTYSHDNQIVVHYPNREQMLFTGQRRLGRHPNQASRSSY